MTYLALLVCSVVVSSAHKYPCFVLLWLVAIFTFRTMSTEGHWARKAICFGLTSQRIRWLLFFAVGLTMKWCLAYRREGLTRPTDWSIARPRWPTPWPSPAAMLSRCALHISVRLHLYPARILLSEVSMEDVPAICTAYSCFSPTYKIFSVTLFPHPMYMLGVFLMSIFHQANKPGFFWSKSSSYFLGCFITQYYITRCSATVSLFICLIVI